MDSVNPQAPAGNFFGRFGVKFYRCRILALRYWWLLLLTGGLGLGFEAWSLHRKPRLFDSSSQIFLREELNTPSDNAKYSLDRENFVGTALAMLKAPEILVRARQRVELDAPQYAGAEPPDITTALAPHAFLWTVTGRGKDPEYTRRFVDATVSEFIKFRIESRTQNYSNLNGGIRDQVAKLQNDVKEGQAKLQDFITKNNMPFWNEQAKQRAEYLSGLKMRQAALQTELHRLQNLTPDQLLNAPPVTVSARSPSGSEAAGASGGAESFAGDLYSVYLQRTQDLAQAQARLAERSKVWKPKHPKFQALKEAVEEAQRAVDVIKQQNRDQAAQRVDAIKAELKSLDQSTSEWDKKVMEASGKDAEYKTLQDNVTRAQATLDKVTGESASLGNDSQLDVFNVLQRATPATEVPLDALKNLLLGLFGGLAVGVGILVLRDRADDRMNSSAETMSQFDEPILGQIPNVIESRGESGLPLLQPDDERYTFAEAFRSLRSSLIFMPNQSELRTIIVTSAIPNEGKSTIASNLAITMAGAGAKIVVVDADLRRGDLASLFDTDGRTGISNVLRGETTWKNALQKTKYPTLSLLPRGPVTNQSSELLLLPSVETLLDDLKENFDLVIFNTAPILATDDTPTLAPHFDGTLMVIRAQFTSARLTHNALNALYQRQVNVLGLILNCVDTEMPDYYYYRYPKYYAAQ